MIIGRRCVSTARESCVIAEKRNQTPKKTAKRQLIKLPVEITFFKEVGILLNHFYWNSLSLAFYWPRRWLFFGDLRFYWFALLIQTFE